MTNKKKIVILLSVLALIGLLYFIFKKKKEATTLSLQTPKTFNVQPASPERTDVFPLSVENKSFGENVKMLQSALNKLVKAPYLPIVVDQDFGDKTKAAVINWVGAKYYPVTKENFDTIISKSTYNNPLTYGI